MMKTRASAALLAAALVAGCASNVPLQRAQTAGFKQGDSTQAVAALLGNASVKLEHEFDANGRRFRAQHFMLQTGARQEMAMMCTPTCVPYFYSVPVTAPYVLIFSGDPPRLFDFGMIEELSRSPVEETAKIMPALKESERRALEAAQKKP